IAAPPAARAPKAAAPVWLLRREECAPGVLPRAEGVPDASDCRCTGVPKPVMDAPGECEAGCDVADSGAAGCPAPAPSCWALACANCPGAWATEACFVAASPRAWGLASLAAAATASKLPPGV